LWEKIPKRINRDFISSTTKNGVDFFSHKIAPKSKVTGSWGDTAGCVLQRASIILLKTPGPWGDTT
jgi:hypothetical protein